MNETIEKYLKNADIAFVNGQHEKALELCQQAIHSDPTISDAYTGAGKVCIVLNKLEESISYFEKAIELNDSVGEKYFDLANAKFGLNQFSEALEYYAKAQQLECEPEILQKVYYQTGIINYIMDDKKSALINFIKAEKSGSINPDLKDITLKKIQIYLESKDYSNAHNAAIQLKMLAPSEFKSYQILFQVLVAMQKFDKAQEVLDEAVIYADDHDSIDSRVDICLNKSLILTVQADLDANNASKYYQEAFEIFDEFLSHPDLPSASISVINFAKSEICLKLERFEEALEAMSFIDEETGNVEKANFIKLSCYMGIENYDEANKYITPLKNSENIYYNYFAVYCASFIASKQAKVDETKKELAEANYNLAIAYFKNKTFENPGDIFSLIFRARLYAENAKYFKAEEIIELFPEGLKVQLEAYIERCKKEN